MRKDGVAIFGIFWFLTLPLIILGVGFGGVRIFSPYALAEELSKGRFEGLVMRALLAVYIAAPIIVLRRGKRQRK